MVMPSIFFILPHFFGNPGSLVGRPVVLLAFPRKLDLHIFHCWVSVRREIRKPFFVVRYLHAIAARVRRRAIGFLLDRAALFANARGDFLRRHIANARGDLRGIGVKAHAVICGGSE